MTYKRKKKKVAIFPIFLTTLTTLILLLGTLSAVFLSKKNSENRSQAMEINSACKNIIVNTTKDTYLPNENLTINISNYPSSINKIDLYYIRTSQNTRKGENWTKITTLDTSSTQSISTDWNIPEFINATYPYNSSEYQEFFVVANIYQNNKLICSGNPDAGQSLDYLNCPNCKKMLITKPNVSNTSFDLKDYFNIKSGYSFTFNGKRFDNPKNDNNQSVSGNSITRMEYEAPIQLCSSMPDLIPQRFTKSNIWGYWSPAKPLKNDRTNMWTNGKENLRFFIAYQNNALGAYGFKMYNNNSMSINTLGNYSRTFVLNSLSNENMYYPPYLLGLDKTPLSGSVFSRIDSIYSTSENKNEVCEYKEKNEGHGWYVKSTVLNDSTLLSEFSEMRQYFPNKKIIVQTYFESVDPNRKMAFREDWYIMEDVGLIGIDQASYSLGGSDSIRYFNAKFMKTGSSTPPHSTQRATRAYLGEKLNISVSPQAINPGGTYTLSVKSANTNMPYDGYLEYRNSDGSGTLWKSPINNQPLWVTNGKVDVKLTNNFPKGIYNAKFRAAVTKSPSNQEDVLSYQEMPWSNSITVVVK